MLETMTIRNVVIIDRAEISFKKGLNIISGETGAGKSILIEAISLLLGARANIELIRTGEDEAVVEGLFNVAQIAWINARLEAHGIATMGDELLIKRVVNRNGKHRITINGELATLSNLQNICEGLVDLCSQHEHQSLLKAATQLDLLDRYGNLEGQTKAFGETHGKLHDLARELRDLEAKENERSRRFDFLKFQIEELRGAALEEGEDENLQTEKQLLQSAEARVQMAEAVRQTLEADEEGALTGLRSALSKLRSLQPLDEKITPYLEGLERAFAETEEVAMGLNRYLGSIDLNQERLESVQERLSLIADLKRKYGSNIQDMITTLTTLEEEFNGISMSENRKTELKTELELTGEALRKQAKKLSTARAKVAKLLSDSVSGELRELRMSEAQFEVELSLKEDLWQWSSSGADGIQFKVRTNAGEEFKALGKIASGGELSRLMLAVRHVISTQGGIGVYLFDEIDAGIGGQTAFQVGKKLKSVAKHNQVLCITHLPQVASFADKHWVVSKSTTGKRTLAAVTELTAPQRKEELARMLGGEVLTKKSLENAAELMAMARA